VITIGIDPDSKAHGVAVYKGTELIELKNLDLMGVVNLCNYYSDHDNLILSIENTLATNALYARNKNSNRKIENRIALYTGRCQQSQQELQRALAYYGYSYILHNPTKNNWADNKDYFNRITGWEKSSNKDTRSAAYFGFLSAKKGKTT
jgi:hypothetical protein